VKGGSARSDFAVVGLQYRVKKWGLDLRLSWGGWWWVVKAYRVFSTSTIPPIAIQ
jgi:hypothetical protein